MYGKMKIIGKSDNIFGCLVLLDDRKTRGILYDNYKTNFVYRDEEDYLYMKNQWDNSFEKIGYVTRTPVADLLNSVAEWRNGLPKNNRIQDIPDYVTSGRRLSRDRLIKNNSFAKAKVLANFYQLEDMLKDNPFLKPDIYENCFIVLYDNPASENHYKSLTSMDIEKFASMTMSAKRDWLNVAQEAFFGN